MRHKLPVSPLERQLESAIALHQKGRLNEARAIYEAVLRISPGHADSLHLLGVVNSQVGNFELAVDLITKAIAINPAAAGFYVNRANALRALGKFDEALASVDMAISIQSDYAEAYYNRGNILQDMGRLESSISSYDKAIKIGPICADFYFGRGNVLQLVSQFEAAVESYNLAILFRDNYPEAYFNRGNALLKLRRFDSAVTSFEGLIKLRPNFAEAYNGMGLVLQASKRYDDAISNYDKAIHYKPDFVEAYFNRAISLSDISLIDAALDSYERASALNPCIDYLLGLLLHTRMRLCEWADFEDQLAVMIARIEDNQRSALCFPVITLTDRLSVQHKAAQILIADKHPANEVLGPLPRRARSSRIRIGYYSADFHTHATSWLMAELFERHDRSRFELFAFSYGPDRQDEMRQRVARAFDHFMDVRMKSDEEVARLSRSWGIDIAVDLKGFTQDARNGIFALRAAPIQVNYLGYPGTVGAGYMDYLIADHTLIPEQSRRHYAEKIVYLPNSYQVNDRKRRISERIFTKAEVGLPEQGFVFCCFNNNYKITPGVFDSWVRIMNAVPGSVLWLFEDNATAATNLRKEAVWRGLDPSRLVFAGRMDLSEHLARHRLADLFLDTLPCNAHTTASDALWAGLPVLTQIGESFAARVAASLLNAIGLPELITETQGQYESLAIELATNLDRLQGIKERLGQNRLSMPLFDTDLYTGHLEAAYTTMYERYQADLRPDHIMVL